MYNFIINKNAKKYNITKMKSKYKHIKIQNMI